MVSSDIALVSSVCFCHLSARTHITFNCLYILDNGASLDDLSSPQYKAYNWLVTLGISGTDITSDEHFLQRYGLAVLFFR